MRHGQAFYEKKTRNYSVFRFLETRRMCIRMVCVCVCAYERVFARFPFFALSALSALCVMRATITMSECTKVTFLYGFFIFFRIFFLVCVHLRLKTCTHIGIGGVDRCLINKITTLYIRFIRAQTTLHTLNGCGYIHTCICMQYARISKANVPI